MQQAKVMPRRIEATGNIKTWKEGREWGHLTDGKRDYFAHVVRFRWPDGTPLAKEERRFVREGEPVQFCWLPHEAVPEGGCPNAYSIVLSAVEKPERTQIERCVR